MLNINFIPMKQSIIDMAQTLVEIGYIPDYKKNPKPESSGFLTKLLIFGVAMPAILYSLNKKYDWV